MLSLNPKDGDFVAIALILPLSYGLLFFIFLPSSFPLKTLPLYVGGLTCVKSLLVLWPAEMLFTLELTLFLCGGLQLNYIIKLLEVILELRSRVYDVNIQPSQGLFAWAMFPFTQRVKYKICLSSRCHCQLFCCCERNFCFEKLSSSVLLPPIYSLTSS